MAIHAAGPRLFKSIPFRHIAANRKGEGLSGAAVNVALNVVPFVDMMTILVTFLLMVFATDGALLAAQAGLKLPDAARKAKLKKAPLIVVTRDDISFEGKGVARVADLQKTESLEWKIIPLFDEMKAEQQKFGLNGYDQLSDVERGYCENPKDKPKPEEVCLKGLVILQADRDTPIKVLNRVVKTAYAAEYVNIMFAVNRRDRRD
jgi:biopolymer transport protein ExbD